MLAGRRRWRRSSRASSGASRRCSTSTEPRFAAIDLGAESGRVAVGRLAGGRVWLDVVHRFENRPVRLPDGLRWNLLGLFSQALEGLEQAAAAGPLAGVGVDS